MTRIRKGHPARMAPRHTAIDADEPSVAATAGNVMRFSGARCASSASGYRSQTCFLPLFSSYSIRPAFFS